MKQYEKSGIKFGGESMQLLERYKDYSFSATYSETNIHSLSTKIMNMTMGDQIVVSHADGVTSGYLNLTFTKPGNELPVQQQKHGGFELIFVANGSFLEMVGEKEYRLKEFDAILMNPNCKSMMTELDNLIAIVVTISREYLEQYGLLKELKNLLSHKSCYDAAYPDAEYVIFRAEEQCVPANTTTDEDNISIQRKEDVKALLYQLHDELRKKTVGYDFIVPGLLKRLLDSLNNTKLYTMTAEREAILEKEELAEQMKAYLDETPKKVTVEELTDIFHYNRNYLANVFVEYTNWSIKDYNRKICMIEAKRLLSEKKLPVTEVAERVGYMSRSQFYHNFKEYFGCLPTEIN